MLLLDTNVTVMVKNQSNLTDSVNVVSCIYIDDDDDDDDEEHRH